MYKIKKAKVVLWTLSKQEIDDLTVNKNIKIRAKRSRPLQSSVNKNYTPSLLRKDNSGKKTQIYFLYIQTCM